MTRFHVSTARGELHLRVGSVSHVGKVRSVNEDAVLAEPPVFAVADGMGGHAFGDRASAAAILALRDEFDPQQVPDSSRVFAAIQRANSAVRDLTAPGGSDRVIAGTTLTGLALVVEHSDAEPQWMIFNLGDSRVYRWLDGPGAGGRTRALERVSVDHSLVQELLDAGKIDEAGARAHPERNVVTRALGAADEVSAEAWLLPASEPQIFLICSDGLTKELDDGRIAELLVALDPSESSDAAVDRLLAAALEAGGGDNVSIVLVRANYEPAQRPDVDDGTRRHVDEQTRERSSWAEISFGLSPELDDTRPRR